MKKVTKQIGEVTVQRHDAGSLDSGVFLGASCSYSPKSELESLYRYENISKIWSNVFCSFKISMLNTDLEFRYLMFKIFIAYIMNMSKCGECVTFQKWLVDSDRP